MIPSILRLAFAFTFFDHQELSLRVEPIHQLLQISDIEIRSLGGFAFARTSIFISVPIGRVVDRFGRVRIRIG